MHIEQLQEQDFAQYDNFVKGHQYGSVFQSRDWRQYQAKAFGLKSTLLIGKHGSHIKNSALFFTYPLPFHKTYFYAPRGPLFCNDRDENDELIASIQEEARSQQAIFFRMDPLLPSTEYISQYITSKPHASTSHQPQTTLLLDLTKGEELLLKEMKEKGRYNIRLAEKKGVVVTSGSVDELYPLLKATGERDGFSIHTPEKYTQFVDCFGENILLLLAKFEEKVIAGGIFLFDATTAIYYYGASSNEYRNLMAPYLVQWRAIQEGIKRGCTAYDFLGISPDDDPNHPWQGVTEFKLKFGGQKLAYMEPTEIICQPFWRHVYHLRKRV